MIRIAVVDAGPQLPAYAAALDELEGVCLAAVVESTLPAAGEARAVAIDAAGAEIVATSLNELLAKWSSEFDAVVLHKYLKEDVGLVGHVAQAQKHLLVGFPIAATIDDVDRVLHLCQVSGTQLMAAQPLRRWPSQQTAHAAIRSGKIGELGLVRIHHWTDAGSRGSILERCAGEVDLACWLFGGRPQTIYATGFGHERQEGSVAGVQLHLGFSQGGMALVGCASIAREVPESYFTLTAIGSQGAVYADDHRNMNLLFRNDITALKVGQGTTHVAGTLQDFAAAIHGDLETGCSVEDARRALAVVDAAAESLNLGAVETWMGDRYGFS